MLLAEYRFCYKKGKLGYAKSHAAYILREENYTSRKEELVYKETGNMEMFDGTSAVKFWEYADTYERANSVVYREIEVNIPNEFNHEQAKELINNFVKKELGEKYIYTYAIHESYNSDGEKNLHCHLMFSERELDGINRELSQFFKRANSKEPEKGGAEKNREWQDKSRLLELRKSWEIESNNLLEKYGFEARVDCRSLLDIRRELLEKEMFDDAEKYNRVPVNISGKILYKVDRKIPLNEKETEKYNNFLKAKKIRIEKIMEKEYKDLITNVEKLEKQDTRENALNIITRGKYFKLKKSYFAIIRKYEEDPKNKNLLNEKVNLENQIDVLKNSVNKSGKYINICKELESNRIRDLEKTKNLLVNKFGEKYYKDLKISIEKLEKQDSRENAINVITRGKYFKLKRTHFAIVKKYENYPRYESLLNEKINLEKQIDALKNSVVKSEKYINISEEFELNRLKKLEEAKNLLINKFTEKYYKDLKADIEKLEKKDSKENALNIVTKGKYFKLKKSYFAIVKKHKEYPENETLLNEKINLEKQIDALKNSVNKSIKYANISEELELKRIRDLEETKNLLENKFGEKYFSKAEEKIVNKYKDTDRLNLKIKEQILLSEDPEEKAINVLTDYKYNRELVVNFNMQNQKILLEKQYQEATLFNPGEVKNIRDKISEYDKNIELSKKSLLNMINNIGKNKLEELSKKIKDNKELELKVIREIISEDKITLTGFSYEKERLELLNKHSSLEKIYNKENSKEERNNKKLYNLSLEIGAIENLLNNEYRITKNTEELINKNLNRINRDIERNNNRIKVADDTITKVNNIIKAHSKKHNLSGVEIVAIGRLSKNKYWKLYKQQKELKREISKEEKALQNMGPISFGKNVLKKSIALHKQELIFLNNKEKEIVKRYKNNPNFKKEIEKVNQYYTKVLKDCTNISIRLKQENKVNYKLKSNVINHEKAVTTMTRIPKRSRSKGYTRSFSPGSLRRNINNLVIVDNAEIRSNLDINLKTEKEKEYEWER